MLSTNELSNYNDSLLLKYGRIFDRPKYRITWSTEAFEQRYVEGKEYIGNIYLRDVKAIKEMPKYPRDKDRYVLEILVEIPAALKDELVGDRGLTYEPLYFFKKKEQYIQPNWLLIDCIACFSHFPIVEAVDSLVSQFIKADRKEYEECLDIINDELPDMAIALRRGHAAFIDSTKKFHLIN